MKKKFNIKDLRPSEYVLDVTHPGSLSVIGTVTIVSPDSAVYINKGKDIFKARPTNPKDITGELIEQENIALTAYSVRSWDEDLFGEYSEKAVVELLSDKDYTWLREQIEVAQSKKSNFFIK